MLRLGFYLQAFLLGLQHSFEPDHMAAVSVLATEKHSMRSQFLPILWRSSQWALGHGLVLLLLSFIAMAFKSALPETISGFVEVWVVGPLMIGLGILALYRAFTLYSHVHTHSHDAPNTQDADHHHNHLEPDPSEQEHNHLHTHTPNTLTIFNRSFGVGMLHGAAGTGGALAVALGLAAENITMAMMILLVESIGVLVAMGVYSLLLVYTIRLFAERHTVVLRVVNIVVGLVSIAVGILWIYRGFFAEG